VSETLEYVRMFARFPLGLRRFLRQKMTLQDAQDVVRRRMTQRESNFLRIAERSIYRHPGSPYLALLQMAGCTLGDLEALVRQRGLEGALLELRKADVYVTFEEFKGRKPIVRHGQIVAVTSRSFDNPAARCDFAVQTGGSTGRATSVGQDLDYIAAGAAHQALMLEAYGLWDAPTVHWQNSFPGNGWRFILQRAYLRQYARRWYVFGGWRDSAQWPKYTLASMGTLLSMRLCGARVPFPQVVRLGEAEVVARWMSQTLLAEGRCLLYSGTSRALRVGRAAEEAGLDLRGATARVGGEPITHAKYEAITRSGMCCLPTYGMNETGTLGIGCQHRSDADDVHLLHDAFAFITYPHLVEQAGVQVPAINLTSLVDSSFKVMLNYQTDDYGIVEERNCGCPFDGYGYTAHLRCIGSYSKLVGESVSLIGNEMVQILEGVLPARFGGTPLDYQLLEEEDGDGFTRLYLVIDPRIDIRDEAEVVETVYAALRRSSPMADAARAVWQQAGALRVRRKPPLTTARGKLLPLYIRRGARGP